MRLVGRQRAVRGEGVRVAVSPGVAWRARVGRMVLAVGVAGLVAPSCTGGEWLRRHVGEVGGPPDLKLPAAHHVPVTQRPRANAPHRAAVTPTATLGAPALASIPQHRADPDGLSPPASAGGRVDTVTFWSQSLGARKRMLVWLPPSYPSSRNRRYPLVIYLHGLWGNETNWVTLGGIDVALDSLASQQRAEFVVAMPDGDDGWYTTWNFLGDYPACRRDFTDRDGDTVDSYCVPWLHYDDYIARDVVAEVQRRYRTDTRRERRAIAGLSMGGYGAVSLAMAYPDVFSAAASHSGVLSPLYDGDKPFAPPARYAASIERLQTLFGPRFWPLIAPAFGPDTAAWWSRDPARRVRHLWQSDRHRMPALFLDVGTEDGLLEQNRAFRHELVALGVPHEYHEWPGEHDWPYWKRHVHESLRFLASHLSAR